VTDLLLKPQELAEMLRMGVDWVYAETRANRIPHIMLGRYPRYRLSRIEKWLTELEAGTLGPRTKRPRAADTAGGMAQGEVTP
jgi:excisionase family DNA binding protein